MKTVVRTELFDVAKRLKELGLRVDLLTNPVHAAYQAWSNCSVFDPRMYAGLTFWAVAVRHLRFGLVPLEWTTNDDGNYSLTISPDGSLAIAVATGDEFTGIADETPSTQSKKGPKTVAVVAANNRQLGLDLVFPDGMEPPLLDPWRFGNCATWLLLMNREDKVIRRELSHPLGFADDQRVSGWKERIILPDIELDSLDDIALPDDDLDFDVSVVRRSE